MILCICEFFKKSRKLCIYLVTLNQRLINLNYICLSCVFINNDFIKRLLKITIYINKTSIFVFNKALLLVNKV